MPKRYIFLAILTLSFTVYAQASEYLCPVCQKAQYEAERATRCKEKAEAAARRGEKKFIDDFAAQEACIRAKREVRDRKLAHVKDRVPPICPKDMIRIWHSYSVATEGEILREKQYVREESSKNLK